MLDLIRNVAQVHRHANIWILPAERIRLRRYRRVGDRFGKNSSVAPCRVVPVDFVGDVHHGAMSLLDRADFPNIIGAVLVHEIAQPRRIVGVAFTVKRRGRVCIEFIKHFVTLYFV
jgi:hypothetical protein